MEVLDAAECTVPGAAIFADGIVGLKNHGFEGETFFKGRQFARSDHFGQHWGFFAGVLFRRRCRLFGALCRSLLHRRSGLFCGGGFLGGCCG